MIKVSYACWLRISKCSFLSVVRRSCCFGRWTRYTEERNVCMACAFCGVWRLLVNMRESDGILSRSHTWESVLALQVKQWKRESVLEDEVFIENTCLGGGSKKKRGTKFKWGRSLNTDHVVLLANGFPRNIVYVRPPSLFREQVVYRPF